MRDGIYERPLTYCAFHERVRLMVRGFTEIVSFLRECTFSWERARAPSIEFRLRIKKCRWLMSLKVTWSYIIVNFSAEVNNSFQSGTGARWEKTEERYDILCTYIQCLIFELALLAQRGYSLFGATHNLSEVMFHMAYNYVYLWRVACGVCEGCICSVYVRIRENCQVPKISK